MNQHLQILNKTDDTQRLVGQAYSLTDMTAFIKQVVYKGSNMTHKSTLEIHKQHNNGYKPKPRKLAKGRISRPMITKNQRHNRNRSLCHIGHVNLQQGFRLRGVQPLSQIWQLLGTGLSTNRINHSYHPTVPLVLSWITGMTINISRIKLTCLATV